MSLIKHIACLGKRTKARDNKTKKYKLYNNDNISTALDYINHHGISCEKAAELHGIPYRTLARHHRSQQSTLKLIKVN